MGSRTIRTVVEPGGVAFRVAGSRFIGHVAPASSPDEAEAVIASVAGDHPDATHVVTARRLDGEPLAEGYDDAGEPGGSAGKPALEVLRGSDLLDVVAVVIRYYGGTDLGYGGLVRAYVRAVREAIEAATVVERTPRATFDVEVDYEDSGTVRAVLESEAVDFEAAYAEGVTFTVHVAVDRADAIKNRLRSATRGRAGIR